MFNLNFFLVLSVFGITNADRHSHRNATLITNADRYSHRNATLKPISACCEIPELGDEKYLLQCSDPKMDGPCNDVQCVFEKSGFLINNSTLNKDAYRNHLYRWVEKHDKEWTTAVERAVQDCVDKEIRQYLDYECKAYDAFACTSIALVKRCPDFAWIC